MIMCSEWNKKIKDTKMTMDTRSWVPATWGVWSSWSSCSRSCGRGISMQSRDCIRETRRWKINQIKSTENHSSGRCLGIYKRFIICNEKPCPNNEDKRITQCASLNSKTFRGNKYLWEPYFRDVEDCQLNCRPVGYKFFVNLAKVVEDGTSCGFDGAKVCISGQCKTVGCDGVVGSGKKFDQCGVCGGDNSTCRIVSGLYTRPTLPVGYNLIAKIPSGACNINITELKKSNNYLALRTSSGNYIINGNWAIKWSGNYEAVGTTFTYIRHDSQNNQLGESITAKGPTNEEIDLLIIFQHPNSGIKYEYSLPIQERSMMFPDNNFQLAFRDGPQTSPRRTYKDVLTNTKNPHQPDSVNSILENNHIIDPTYRNKIKMPHPINTIDRNYRRFESKATYRWKLAGLSECTQSCGGGTQRTIVSCVKQNTLSVVPDIHCELGEKPEIQIVRCNTQPCPAVWVPGEWESCSVTCGEGIQRRKLLCKQEVSPTLNINVAEGACHGQERLPSIKKCFIKPCVHWKIGEWGKCSADCGKGMRKRDVTCVTDDDTVTLESECVEKKPETEEMCDMAPCVNTWFFSEWTQKCSVECGKGHLFRKVICLHGSGKSTADGACDLTNRPESQKSCINEKGCGGKWFVGPWSQCSVTCGNGTQSRVVLCLSSEQDSWKIIPDIHCDSMNKPKTEQPCQVQLCTDEWYTSEWTECSKPCDTGVQTREITCINNEQCVSMNCDEIAKPPIRQACNTIECPEVKHDSGCVDKFRNCNLVVQARLCSYTYYRNICCDSCYPFK